MNPTDLLLPLVAAFWAFCTLLFAVTRHLNEIRDKVLSGRDARGPLTRRHMHILVDHDWKPLTFASVFASALFSVIALASPLLISEKRGYACWILATLVGLGCAFMAFAWGIYAPRDLKEMRKAISDHVDACGQSD